jgi:hypothetical protein
VATGPWDPMTAGAAFPGGLLASDADRDQMLDVVAAVFAQGRLTWDERVLRTGQVLAARTQAELAAIAAALAAIQPPPPPARARARKRVIRKIAACGVCVLIVLPLLSIAFRTYDGGFLIVSLLTLLGSAVAAKPPAPRRRR